MHAYSLPQGAFDQGLPCRLWYGMVSGELREGLPPDSPRPRGGTGLRVSMAPWDSNPGRDSPGSGLRRGTGLRSPGRRQAGLGESDRSKLGISFEKPMLSSMSIQNQKIKKIKNHKLKRIYIINKSKDGSVYS